MTVYKIKYRFKSTKKPNINNEIIDYILLDKNTGQEFLQELDKFIVELEDLSIDNSTKIKKLKYFIKSYKFKDISLDTKLITINAERNTTNKKGILNITTDANIKLNNKNNHNIKDRTLRNNLDFTTGPSILPEKVYSLLKNNT